MKKLIKKLRGKQKKLFRSGWLQANQQIGGIQISDSDYVAMINSSTKNTKEEDTRIEKLPVEVYKEIFSPTPIIDCVSLDNKIELVEKRINVLTSVGIDYHQISNEIEALGFLKARKKYEKYKELFGWATTNDELIEKLCKTYKVKMVDFGSYQRNVPEEAIDQLENFVAAYDKVRDDQVILKLIIDDTPKSKERKKDPILLAASPFGAWWYVLGAWDKEVEIIDDLIYKKQ